MPCCKDSLIKKNSGFEQSVLLSIILPVYNVQSYIEECLDSLCSQDLRNAEIICIDDGSSDKSGFICDEYSKRYSYVKVIHTSNNGVAAARNTGMSLAKGKYIAWVDPDDYVDKSWFNTLFGYLLNDQYDLIVFDYIKVNNQKYTMVSYKDCNVKIDKHSLIEDIVADQIIQSNLWHKVFRKTLFDGIIFPKEYMCMEDYSILVDVIDRVDSILYIPKSLYYYRIRNDGLVRQINLQKSYDSVLIAQERYSKWINVYPNISKIGYLTQMLGFCIQFNKCDANSRAIFFDRYQYFKNIVKDNALYLLNAKDVPIRIKVQLFFVYFNLTRIALKVKGYIGI